jgi:hypothetical protein
MQTNFFGRNALWGVFSVLFTGLILAVATGCGSDDPPDPGTSSPRRSSSSAFEKPPEVVSKDVSIQDTTFRWADGQQNEVWINVSVTLTAEGDTTIKGFDSVLVELNGKLLHKGGQSIFFYQYNKMFDPLISVEDELGLGVCGTDVVLTVKVYAFAKRDVEMQVSKTLKKDNTVGNCRSSSSAAPSSSSAFKVVPLTQIKFNGIDSVIVKKDEGISLSGGSVDDLIFEDVGAERTIKVGSNISSITDKFMRNVEENECGSRGLEAPANTDRFYPCLDATPYSFVNCDGASFKLVKTKDAADATDWTSGWYLVWCKYLAGQGAMIKAWKTN